MNKKAARQAQSNLYPTAQKNDIRSVYTGRVTLTKGATLEDFYREVHSAHLQNGKHVYHNKNAAEIESIMRHNRKQIDEK